MRIIIEGADHLVKSTIELMRYSGLSFTSEDGRDLLKRSEPLPESLAEEKLPETTEVVEEQPVTEVAIDGETPSVDSLDPGSEVKPKTKKK